MNKNKGSACNTPGVINSDNRLLMKNNSLYQNKLQQFSSHSRRESTKPFCAPASRNHNLPKIPAITIAAFVCDECARPLNLYGENFIETYTNGKANILRCLCDLHADEMEVNAR